jgi:hypothetical protein
LPGIIESHSPNIHFHDMITVVLAKGEITNVINNIGDPTFHRPRVNPKIDPTP